MTPSRPSTPSDTQRPTTRRHRRRIWFRGVILIFGLAMAAICAELVVRVYIAARGWTPNCYVLGSSLLQPHETNGYTLARNFRFQSGVLKISTNQYGLRGPDISAQKAPGVRRIAIIGGSSVFGYFVSDGEEAARLLQAHFEAAGEAVEVINAGVPGYNLIQSRQRFRTVVAPHRPDLVILYLGWNDLVYLLKSNPDPDIVGRGPCAASWERIVAKSALYGLVAHRLLNAPVAQFNPPSQSSDSSGGARQSTAGITAAGAALFRTQLEHITREVRKTGADLLICSQAMLAHPDVDRSLWRHLGETEEAARVNIRRGQWLRETLESFAAGENVPFVDIYSQIAPTAEHLGDAIHLTKIGEQRLADILFVAVEKTDLKLSSPE